MSGERAGIAGACDGVVDSLRAFALGLRDTAEDVVREGRRGAREANDEGWRRFETKTKHRRPPKAR